jgi:hypothetical protein
VRFYEAYDIQLGVASPDQRHDLGLRHLTVPAGSSFGYVDPGGFAAEPVPVGLRGVPMPLCCVADPLHRPPPSSHPGCRRCDADGVPSAPRRGSLVRVFDQRMPVRVGWARMRLRRGCASSRYSWPAVDPGPGIHRVLQHPQDGGNINAHARRTIIEDERSAWISHSSKVPWGICWDRTSRSRPRYLCIAVWTDGVLIRRRYSCVLMWASIQTPLFRSCSLECPG